MYYITYTCQIKTNELKLKQNMLKLIGFFNFYNIKLMYNEQSNKF